MIRIGLTGDLWEVWRCSLDWDMGTSTVWFGCIANGSWRWDGFGIVTLLTYGKMNFLHGLDEA